MTAAAAPEPAAAATIVCQLQMRLLLPYIRSATPETAAATPAPDATVVLLQPRMTAATSLLPSDNVLLPLLNCCCCQPGPGATAAHEPVAATLSYATAATSGVPAAAVITSS
jgi:hypothetical protein